MCPLFCTACDSCGASAKAPKPGGDTPNLTHPAASRKVLQQIDELARARHERHAERPDDDRPVAEQPADQRSLELDRGETAHENGRLAPPDDSLLEDDPLGRDDEPRPVPAPHGSQAESRPNDDARGTEHRNRPAQRQREGPGGGERERPHERPGEDDAVAPRLEADALRVHGQPPSPPPRALLRLALGRIGEKHSVSGVARRAFVATIVVVAVVVGALALWKLKLIIALLFFAFVIAAAMRPGITTLREHGIPRGI